MSAAPTSAATDRREHRNRWRRAAGAEGLDDHPRLRQGRHRDSALLLPREAADRRQLPHVPGRRREDAEAGARLRHAGDGRHEGLHPDAARARCAAQRDGIPAGQPSAGLPDLRPGRRVRIAGRVDGLWPLRVALRRPQARGRRRGHGPAGRHRHDPLHPVHALRPLHRRHRRHLRTRRHESRREPADRHLRRQAADDRTVRQRHRRLPGRRADQQGVPLQGARLGADRPRLVRLSRRARLQPAPAHPPRRSRAHRAARQRSDQRMLAVGPRSLFAPGPVLPATAALRPMLREGDGWREAELGRSACWKPPS